MTSASAEAPTIVFRLPSKYVASPSSNGSSPNANAFSAPPLAWMLRTWSVTHSTLSMWRTARNVRISYAPLPARTGSRPAERNTDRVEYEAADGKGGVKSVAGINTASSPGDTALWDWRGKGLLCFVSSHWEVLAWGERPLPDGGGVERWVVTWFTPTLFTQEGVDIYCDRKEGGSKELVDDILAALRGLSAKPLVEMCERDMQPVEIKLPWKER